MFNCHCLLHVSDRYSSLDWVVMVCLATLAHGQVSLVLTGCANFAGLAPWVMRSILFLSVPIYNPFGTNIQDSNQVQFLWQDDLVNVSKPTEFICECMDVMLGDDSDNQSQTSDQP